MMVQRFTITIFLILLFFNFSYSQEVQRANIKYTPSDNGYELNIPFKWKFIDCYGEVHVTITKNTKDITSDAYIYNGVRYTSVELEEDAFSKPECGLTNISADVYQNSFRLGHVKMDNVIDWFGGCFGQSYHITELLGLKDEDYKGKISELSLLNLKIDNLSSRDYSLESKIKEIEKNKSLKEKLAEADNAYASGNLENAKKLYEEALEIEYSSKYARSKIAEIKAKQNSKKEEEEFKSYLEKGEKLEEEGNYEGAKSTYQKALKIKPSDKNVQEKIKRLEEKLKEEENYKKNKSEAISEASNRKHSGFMWGNQLGFGSASYGSATQNANLIGYFRLDYEIWTLAGEPAHKFRFYWEWNNFQHTGYPLWVSVLEDEVVQIKELEKYPDLFSQWNKIKPEYIEVESDILYYKNEDNYVANAGRIKVVPEVIGYSGQEVEWSLPSSSNWDELFPYCNGMQWDYFRRLGLYEEIEKHENKFGNKIAWPKYAFEYSDNINFYQSYGWLHSEYRELNSNDYDNYSSSIKIAKVVWPEEQIQSIIKEFKRREKEEKEEKMSSNDFWNTPEDEKTSEQTNFWDTPENDMTQSEKKSIDAFNVNMKEVNQSKERLKWGKEKYSALQNPFTISYPGNNVTVEEGKIDFKGSINQFLAGENAKVEVLISGEKFKTNNNSGNFNSGIILSEGWNTITLEITADGFGFSDLVKVFYKKPPPLPCNEQTNSGGSGQTINEHGLGVTSGVFYVTYDMYSIPDEMIIYQGTKERRSRSNIIFETHGKVSGSDRVRVPFTDIDTGIITVEMNGNSGGTSWNYIIECPK